MGQPRDRAKDAKEQLPARREKKKAKLGWGWNPPGEKGFKASRTGRVRQTRTIAHPFESIGFKDAPDIAKIPVQVGNEETIKAQEKDNDLVGSISRFVSDPYGFVLFAYPWGSGTLQDETGPDAWQEKTLRIIGDKLKDNPNEAIQLAVSSGHGIGKTALVAWIIQWFLSTRPHPATVVTANTKQQLEGKTWRELAKWYKLLVNKAWFEWTATKFYYKGHPETWFASAVPWSKEKSEAFAGTHEKYVLIIFDEASAVDDIIWQVAEGAMTTPGSIWIAFGNPTRNTGRFKECFPGGKFSHRWITRQIDSRTAKKADQKTIDKWIEDYGEDSDFVRVRVRGIFPRTSCKQFIGEDTVQGAINREINPFNESTFPVLFGVDVARFGDDKSVIAIRQGFKTHAIHKFRNIDTMDFVGMIVREHQKWKPHTMFIDAVGIGAGVYDRLKQLGYRVVEVSFHRNALIHEQYSSLRSECWEKMKNWLDMASIPADEDLVTGLKGPEYGFDAKLRLQLESKEDMKSRGLASPDEADAIALTFSYPVGMAKEDWNVAPQQVAEGDYDVFKPDKASQHIADSDYLVFI